MTRLKMATKDTFRSLQHRNFRVFFAYQGVSFTGTWLQLMAQDLLVLELTDSGIALGLLVACQFAPSLLLGAWAGVVVDRTDRRRLLTVCSSVMLVAALALGLLVLTDKVTLVAVYLLAAVLGTANTFDNPARRTMVNDLVPDELVVNAVALNSTLVTSARIIGPALAGLLISTVGIGWCFIINGLTFGVVLVGLRILDWSAMNPRAVVTRGKGQLRAGLAYVRAHDELRIPLLLMAVIGTLSFNNNVLLPLFATRDLGGTGVTYTILASAYGVGSLVGSLRLARRTTIDVDFLARSALWMAASATALAVAPNLPLACAALVWGGYAGIGILSGGNAVLQLHASPEMRGRVLALFTVVFLGSTPIGGPIAGYVAQHFGAPAGMLLGAVAAAASGAVVLGLARRRPVPVPALSLPALPGRS